MVVINGVPYEGNNIQVQGNGIVIIDGKKITGIQGPEVNIVVNGSLENLEVENASSIEVNGPIFGSVNSKNANITCQDVHGNVDNKNGNITCGKVSGDVTTKNGNIKHG